MATLVTMPKLGLTMTEGTISSWSKRKGDEVKKGEIILVVATDKLTYEVEAPEDGVLLDIFISEGESAPVGENIAAIGEPGENVEVSHAEEVSGTEQPGEVAEEPVPVAEMTAVTEKPLSSGPVKASPLARKWARIFNLDLSLIYGTGPEGRVVKDDVMKAAQKFKASPLAKRTARDGGLDITDIPGTGPDGRTVNQDVLLYIEAQKGRITKTSPVASRMAEDLGIDLAAIGKDGRVMKEDVMQAAGIGTTAEKSCSEIQPGKSPVLSISGEKRVPLSPMRKIIAERMTHSASTIPSVVFNIEVDFSEFISFRSKIKKEVSDRGAKVSFNDMLMKVCAKALMENPMANASYDQGTQEYILHDEVNIGLAVAVPGGLLVPNVKSVQSKSIYEIASVTDALVDKARNNKLGMDDMQGGTFTISNLGMFGMHDFTPIINPPEACILAVNAIVEKPVAVNGAVEIRPISMIGLTADHRILDGADAAKFLARIKELIENPYLLMV